MPGIQGECPVVILKFKISTTGMYIIESIHGRKSTKEKPYMQRP